MMIYKNRKTGAVIKSACKISGGDWEPVKAGKDAAGEEGTAPKAAPKTAPKASTKGKK